MVTGHEEEVGSTVQYVCTYIEYIHTHIHRYSTLARILVLFPRRAASVSVKC